MKRYTLIALAAALFPLAGHAEEKALWEIQGRLDGGKNARLNGWMKEFFAKEGSTAPIGDKAVFRIAGFENEATEEEDWVAEIRDLADMGAVIKEIEEKIKPDEQGRYLMEEEGMSFLVWKDGDSLLRLASPPVNAGTTVATTAPLEGDAWVSGWVNLSGISELKELESESLELPESLSFTASSAGEGIVLNVSAGLKSKELAETAKGLLEGFKDELTAASEETEKLPPVTFASEGKKLTIKIELTEAHLDDLIKEVKKAIEER
ncbi:hypothetical protein OKA04_17825 [Luteolibacter flavescens]|uniref:Uncharacterized protein n=1 Tax=Luteolibacter flavescens TaxID=1859460 RepID=A0ABT3FSP5_9BACT|nr:hypothetical protein [Luteolibacter flavescens]MCW1886602.1 hypothetical protein [Luteolibacter flavescens]